ncbi:FRG domain-containing protein [Bradyrhizobium sp. Leo170]|uniref:FRG domain-containing protein n=1 Tax=Bradyrhizobium sp. Leo170 TaxID=1571199 RepID=UPI00102E71F1|nr:FRG domain-containing protein [Bradyrhizobium sp. Leo170]
MQGQWLGSYQGNTQGVVTVELDDAGDHYEGMVYVYPGNTIYPPIAGGVVTIDKSENFALPIMTDVIDMRRGALVPWDAVKSNYPRITLDPTIDTVWSCDMKNNVLVIDFTSKSSGSGKAHLTRSDGGRPPERKPLANVKSWAAFKEYALTLDPNRYVFRGQESSAWRLRTFFHRSGRANLFRFVNQDIFQLHGHLSSLTEHHFNLKDELENAAFFSLVQHHGYPTPLLDWTHSPFIAAYFAFRKKKADGDFARIFVFDAREWQKDIRPVQLVCAALPHFSVLSPLAINNPRMVPQQALSTLANVDDIEAFIAFNETQLFKKTYLEVIDLPVSERPQIMQELSLMGITAGSMFPGLDGTCEQLRERNFSL